MNDQKRNSNSEQLETKTQTTNNENLEDMADVTSSTLYKEINLTDEFRDRELVNSRIVRLFSSLNSSSKQPNRSRNTTVNNLNEKSKLPPPPTPSQPTPGVMSSMKRSKSQIPFECYREYDNKYRYGNNVLSCFDREDYVQIAHKYKSLCKVK